MTVAELIAALQKMPQDVPVLVVTDGLIGQPCEATTATMDDGDVLIRADA